VRPSSSAPFTSGGGAEELLTVRRGHPRVSRGRPHPPARFRSLQPTCSPHPPFQPQLAKGLPVPSIGRRTPSGEESAGCRGNQPTLSWERVVSECCSHKVPLVSRSRMSWNCAISADRVCHTWLALRSMRFSSSHLPPCHARTVAVGQPAASYVPTQPHMVVAGTSSWLAGEGGIM